MTGDNAALHRKEKQAWPRLTEVEISKTNSPLLHPPPLVSAGNDTKSDFVFSGYLFKNLLYIKILRPGQANFDSHNVTTDNFLSNA